jgi:F-type H+-transporting ATPase subunit c
MGAAYLSTKPNLSNLVDDNNQKYRRPRTTVHRRNIYMDALSAAALAEGLKAIGAGLAMLGAIGAGAGIGILVGGAVQGIARNPDASGNIQTNMILGIAFTEAVAIYAFVVALIILFVF